jgi:hypothetical protein
VSHVFKNALTVAPERVITPALSGPVGSACVTSLPVGAPASDCI